MPKPAAGEEAQDAEIKRLAAEFAEEEREHVLALDEWLAKTPRPSTTFADDPENLEPV